MGQAALVGRVAPVSKSQAIVRRIDDRTSASGAQLVKGEGVRPEGHRAEASPTASLLRFSVIDDSAAPVTLKKGDVAVTLGSLGEPFPQGLVIGTVVHEVARAARSRATPSCAPSSTSTRSTS